MSPPIAAAPAASDLPNLDYLMVFVMFRLAAISTASRAGWRAAALPRPMPPQMAAQLEPLADLALAQARAARL